MYYLVVQADHIVDPREQKLGEHMLKVETIDPKAFSTVLDTLETLDEGTLYRESLTLLKKCTQEQQIRIIAWTSLIANADGFMAAEEFEVIHRIYHQELRIDLQAILLQQKKIRSALEEQGLKIIV